MTLGHFLGRGSRYAKRSLVLGLAPLISMAFFAGAALSRAEEIAVTDGKENVLLTNTGCWSPDGNWLVYDTRSTADGGVFDGDRIERVHVPTGKVELLYRSQNGAKCGVVTHHPTKPLVAFILGPEPLDDGFTYGPARRRGVVVDTTKPGIALDLDARDLVAPFTPGALRGGSHVHVWSPQGDWISYTYEDHVLDLLDQARQIGHQPNRRTIGISAPGRVIPRHAHPRNHEGSYFSALVVPMSARKEPNPGELIKVCEEGWIGTDGYLKSDGTRQKRALAFQGTVIGESGKPVVEIFVADLPDDLTVAAQAPLEGTATTMPGVPHGVQIRRLTQTENRPFPGIQGPRHWVRSSPDGSHIAYLAKDDKGITQIYLVSPNGGSPKPLTHNDSPICSCFTWSPDGRSIAHTTEQGLCLTSVPAGRCTVLLKQEKDRPIRPEAVVFSPDGRSIAFMRNIHGKNRIFSYRI